MNRLHRILRKIDSQRKVADHLDELLNDSAAPKLPMLKAHDSGRSVPLRFDSPESSTILAAYYTPSKEQMIVKFKRTRTDRTPSVYQYDGIPVQLWAEFVKAESKGSFFATRIRPAFRGEPKAA